jgi:hypothetical protein
VRSDVYDEEHFPTDGLGREADLRQIALLRERHLAMFADPAWQRLGTGWSGSLETSDAVAVQARWLPAVRDRPADRIAAAHLEGWVTRGIATLRRRGQLVILSDDSVIAGFAEFSFIRPDSPALLLNLPYKRGLDGYIRDYDGHKKYTLAMVDFDANRAITLTVLPAPVY